MYTTLPARRWALLNSGAAPLGMLNFCLQSSNFLRSWYSVDPEIYLVKQSIKFCGLKRMRKYLFFRCKVQKKNAVINKDCSFLSKSPLLILFLEKNFLLICRCMRTICKQAKLLDVSVVSSGLSIFSDFFAELMGVVRLEIKWIWLAIIIF